MTLEYLELLEDMKEVEEKQVLEQAGQQEAPTQLKPARRKLQKSFKSNTRIYDDGSIEVDPLQQGEPSQKEVKKVGKSKRYVTSGRNPLTCVELKCPEDVPDKAAFFQRELAKLTRDIAISEPPLPEGEFLIDKTNLKVRLSAGEHRVMAWLTFDVKGLLEVRRELYSLTSEIDKCFVINEALVCPRQ